MKTVWTIVALAALSSITSSAHAINVRCDHLEKKSYLAPKAYRHDRLRNPFGRWSAELVDDIDNTFELCLSKYRKKYGEEGFKTNKLKEQHAYFESVKGDIKANITAYLFAKQHKGKGRQLMDSLTKMLSEFHIRYDVQQGFSNKELPIERGVLISHPVTTLGSRLPKPLTREVVKRIKQSISELTHWQQDVMSMSGKIDTDDILTRQDKALLTVVLNLANQMESYLTTRRFEPYLSLFDKYQQQLNTQIVPVVNQYERGALDLNKIVQTSELRHKIPSSNALSSITEALLRSAEMLENRGLDKARLASVHATLDVAKEMSVKFLNLRKALQTAADENRHQEAIKQQQAAIKQQQAAAKTKQYFAKAQTTEAANSFKALGYPDAIFSLGKFGPPILSTYAVVHCLSSRFGGHEIEQNGKDIDISFGKQGLFSIDSQYLLRLRLMTAHATKQYVIMDIAEPKSPATQDDMSKLFSLANNIKRCGAAEGISLVNR